MINVNSIEITITVPLKEKGNQDKGLTRGLQREGDFREIFGWGNTGGILDGGGFKGDREL